MTISTSPFTSLHPLPSIFHHRPSPSRRQWPKPPLYFPLPSLSRLHSLSPFLFLSFSLPLSPTLLLSLPQYTSEKERDDVSTRGGVLGPKVVDVPRRSRDSAAREHAGNPEDDKHRVHALGEL